MLNKIGQIIDGYKTYLTVLIGLVGVLLWATGILNEEQFKMWLAVSGLGAVAGFRDALNKK